MLRIEGLTKTYGKTQALNGVSLEVDKGELFGFLGPNGAGKTTAIKVLTGLAVPDGGRAQLDEIDLLRRDVATRRRIGVVHQHVNLDNDLTAWENLDNHGRFYGMGKNRRLRRIGEMLEFAELTDRAHEQIKNYSGGMKRRLMIGRALLHEPELLFLDEPTVGLDPAIRRRVWSLIKTAQSHGTTLFLTTHYIEEAEFLCERVAFIDKGRIVRIDTPDNFKATLGEWAVDDLEDGSIKSRFFKTRKEADRHIVSHPSPLTRRRVNLEDVFLDLTGHGIVKRDRGAKDTAAHERRARGSLGRKRGGHGH